MKIKAHLVFENNSFFFVEDGPFRGAVFVDTGLKEPSYVLAFDSKEAGNELFLALKKESGFEVMGVGDDLSEGYSKRLRDFLLYEIWCGSVSKYVGIATIK